MQDVNDTCQNRVYRNLMSGFENYILRIQIEQLFVWGSFGKLLYTRLSACVGSSVHTPLAHHRNPSVCMER